MMMLSAETLGRLLLDTIRSPAEVARLILRLELGRDVLWMALGLVTVLSVLVAAMLSIRMPAPEAAERPAGAVEITPFRYAMILGGALIIMVLALHFTGLMLGVTGRLEDMLALVAWQQLVLLALQLVQSAFFLLVPPLGLIATVAAITIALWVLVNFINEAQRFGSLGRAAATAVLALLGMGFGLSFVISLITASL